jgi:dihydroneopterin aldolase
MTGKAPRKPKDAPSGGVDSPAPAAQSIVVRDLTVQSSIGVSADERARPQRIRVTLEVEVEPRAPGEDKIAEVVNYGQLVGKVRDVCIGTTTRLLETLAGEIARTCFFDVRVRAVKVRIEKLDRYPDVGGVGVALEYLRESFRES